MIPKTVRHLAHLAHLQVHLQSIASEKAIGCKCTCKWAKWAKCRRKEFTLKVESK